MKKVLTVTTFLLLLLALPMSNVFGAPNFLEDQYQNGGVSGDLEVVNTFETVIIDRQTFVDGSANSSITYGLIFEIYIQEPFASHVYLNDYDKNIYLKPSQSSNGFDSSKVYLIDGYITEDELSNKSDGMWLISDGPLRTVSLTSYSSFSSTGAVVPENEDYNIYTNNNITALGKVEFNDGVSNDSFVLFTLGGLSMSDNMFLLVEANPYYDEQNGFGRYLELENQAGYDLNFNVWLQRYELEFDYINDSDMNPSTQEIDDVILIEF